MPMATWICWRSLGRYAALGVLHKLSVERNQAFSLWVLCQARLPEMAGMYLECSARKLQGCRICHLDRPYGDWPTTVTSVPAAAMRLPHVGTIRTGGPADCVLFLARKYSELLSRPQVDRVRVLLRMP